MPTLDEQIAIIGYLAKATTHIDEAITAARRQIELLREYRTRLISDVVTGKTAQLIFRDPLHATREDHYSLEPRLQTIGIAGPVVLMVIHTPPEPDPTTGEEAGRIISARKADREERERYEEGKSWAH